MSKCEHKFKWYGRNTSKCKNCNLIVPDEIAIAYEDSESDNCVKEWLDGVLEEREQLKNSLEREKQVKQELNEARKTLQVAAEQYADDAQTFDFCGSCEKGDSVEDRCYGEKDTCVKYALEQWRQEAIK